jgi:hypothetical protein
MPANLRLTLRTLLSYLDDTLDPAQAKLIGQKVAESEQARELMERIKQVTRKRRLTTPPPAGPGGIDANTIAEYTDNEVTPEQAEEVERICLASDVHLAEVAACHQILTLVLGEPALVPPSARQRMYGLVKGPEAIPFRKPPRRNPKADLDLSTSDAGHEDDTMRLQGFMRHASVRNTVLLAAGVLLAVGVLVFALYKQLHTEGPELTKAGKDQGVAQIDAKINKIDKEDADKEERERKAAKEQADKKAAEEERLADEKRKEEEKKAQEAKATEPKKTEDKQPLTEIKTGEEEVPFEAPDVTPVVLGAYQPNAKVPDITLQRDSDKDKGTWDRLWTSNTKVSSVRPVMSLPVSRGNIQINKGPHLTLWGSSPDIWPLGFIFESQVQLYKHALLDLDMAINRGRIIVKYARTDGKPSMVRIRFENPTQKKQEAFTVALLDKDAEVMIDRAAYLRPGEPFYEDKANANRIGPVVDFHFVFLGGTAYFHWAGNSELVDATKVPKHIQWSSIQGTTRAQEDATKPDWLLAKPKQGDPKLRAEALAASERLAKNLQGKQLDVVLQEALESDNASSRRLALFCYTALDEYTKPIEFLDKDDPRASDLRQMSIYALRHWMAQASDHEYKVYEAFRGLYKGVVAKKLMELLHGLTPEEEANPVTWQRLIDNLNNDVLPMRELSAWTLQSALAMRNQNAAKLIATRYSAVAPQDVRMQVQRELRVMIPPGQVPMQPAPTPPGAGGKKQ